MNGDDQSRLVKLYRAAYRPVDGSSLAVFRIVFGLSLVVYVVKALMLGEVKGIYVDPQFHFSYWGFGWLNPWPGNGMYVHFLAIGICALLVAAGIAYRLATVSLALLYTFLFLCDRTGYLNHYYLVMLLCWMMVVIPADRVAAVDRLTDPRSPLVPTWALWLVRFHVGLPYFFGGIAKLRADWLYGQPMTMTLSAGKWFPAVTEVVPEKGVIFLFAWGGLVFDLLIVPALIYSRTRKLAFVAVLAFHLTNAFVFPIGIFPWLMIGATTIFFAPDWPRHFWKTAADQHAVWSDSPQSTSPQRFTPGQRLWVTSLCAYAILHCLIPLRHWVTTGDPSWTERGHHFAWHMMLRGKRSALRMYVTDPETRQTYVADLRNYLTAFQYPKVARDPEHIRQLAHLIAAEESNGNGRVEVRAFSLVSLNGREAELLVDPAVDLSAQDASWIHPAWIMELSNPLLLEHWDVPLLKWEEALGLDGDRIIGGIVGKLDTPPSGDGLPGMSSGRRQSTARPSADARS